ncbi:hypothetical protein EV702DRAFT_1051523 [Suillus placidus]|uniref:Uncharacterized protein n=1 Tax=Suillus placidus TaxID=48579 RepID=A0A9P6ZG29_9AGAM|nr:hypothetical protein EV702DRAFT_1051523 [Suillus placidus]
MKSLDPLLIFLLLSVSMVRVLSIILDRPFAPVKPLLLHLSVNLLICGGPVKLRASTPPALTTLVSTNLAPGNMEAPREAGYQEPFTYIYLWDKHLLKFKSGALLQSPPLQMVQAFNHDNENPPSLDNITIDWQDSLRSSLWNTEAVNLLVVDFQQRIQTGYYPSVVFDEDTMSLDDLRVLCIIKLRRTQQTYRDRSKIAALADLQQREEATHELSSRSTRRQHLDIKTGLTLISTGRSKDVAKLPSRTANAILKCGTPLGAYRPVGCRWDEWG